MTEQYKPGDIVNGHMLGNDNQWHPIAAATPPPPKNADQSKKGPSCLLVGGITAAILAFITLVGIFGVDDSNDPKPTATPSLSASEAAAKVEARARAKAALQKKLDTATFPSEHDLALVFKNPAAHEGEVFKVWGSVFQFDAATGTDSFLAEVANRNTTSYGYFDGENAVFTGDPDDFEDLVEEDLFTATIEVAGAKSYDTQIGGNTTVPEFTVHHIERVGG